MEALSAKILAGGLAEHLLMPKPNILINATISNYSMQPRAFPYSWSDRKFDETVRIETACSSSGDTAPHVPCS